MPSQQEHAQMIASMWEQLHKLQQRRDALDAQVTVMLSALSKEQQELLSRQDMLNLLIVLLSFRLGFMEGVNHGSMYGWENALAALDALCRE